MHHRITLILVGFTAASGGSSISTTPNQVSFENTPCGVAGTLALGFNQTALVGAGTC